MDFRCFLTLLVAGEYLALIRWSTVMAGKPGTISNACGHWHNHFAGLALAGVNSGANMARYQKDVSTSSLIWSAAAGAGIPLLIVITVAGPLTAGGSGIASASDPVAAVRDHYLRGYHTVLDFSFCC